MPPILSISALSKHYKTGHKALDAVDLEIRRGEIFALLGPNGEGKTTLISIVCGTVTMTSGTIMVDSHEPPVQHLADIVRNARRFRDVHGWWPMPGWLEAFVRMGLIAWTGETIEILRPLTEAERHATLVLPTDIVALA